MGHMLSIQRYSLLFWGTPNSGWKREKANTPDLEYFLNFEIHIFNFFFSFLFHQFPVNEWYYYGSPGTDIEYTSNMLSQVKTIARSAFMFPCCTPEGNWCYKFTPVFLSVSLSVRLWHKVTGIGSKDFSDFLYDGRAQYWLTTNSFFWKILIFDLEVKKGPQNWVPGPNIRHFRNNLKMAQNWLNLVENFRKWSFAQICPKSSWKIETEIRSRKFPPRLIWARGKSLVESRIIWLETPWNLWNFIGIFGILSESLESYLI